MGKEYQRGVNVESIIPFPADPILIEDFSVIKWQGYVESGGICECEIDREYFISGLGSLRVATPASYPQAGNYVMPYWRCAITSRRYVECRAVVMIQDGVLADTVYIIPCLRVEDGKSGYVIEYRVRFNTNTGFVEFQNADGDFENVGYLTPISQTYWIAYRMLIDLKEEKILEFRVGRESKTIDGVPYKPSAASEQAAFFMLQIETNEPTQAEAYIDQVIVKEYKK